MIPPERRDTTKVLPSDYAKPSVTAPSATPAAASHTIAVKPAALQKARENLTGQLSALAKPVSAHSGSSVNAEDKIDAAIKQYLERMASNGMRVKRFVRKAQASGVDTAQLTQTMSQGMKTTLMQQIQDLTAGGMEYDKAVSTVTDQLKTGKILPLLGVIWKIKKTITLIFWGFWGVILAIIVLMRFIG